MAPANVVKIHLKGLSSSVAFAGSPVEALGVEPRQKPCAGGYRPLPPLSTTAAAGLQTRLERRS